MELRNPVDHTRINSGDWVEVMDGQHAGVLGRVIYADKHESTVVVALMLGDQIEYARTALRKIDMA